MESVKLYCNVIHCSAGVFSQTVHFCFPPSSVLGVNRQGMLRGTVWPLNQTHDISDKQFTLTVKFYSPKHGACIVSAQIQESHTFPHSDKEAQFILNIPIRLFQSAWQLQWAASNYIFHMYTSNLLVLTHAMASRWILDK